MVGSGTQAERGRLAGVHLSTLRVRWALVRQTLKTHFCIERRPVNCVEVFGSTSTDQPLLQVQEYLHSVVGWNVVQMQIDHRSQGKVFTKDGFNLCDLICQVTTRFEECTEDQRIVW